MNHWTDTAINSAQRIYAELESARDIADCYKLDYHEITFGINTDMEADVTIATYANEVKRIDSEAVSAVDKHVSEGSAQLLKRVKTSFDLQNVSDWILKLEIANVKNSWPFTPARFKNLIRQGKSPNSQEIQKEAEDRILKYEKGGAQVKYAYWISSLNPAIGKFTVRV